MRFTFTNFDYLRYFPSVIFGQGHLFKRCLLLQGRLPATIGLCASAATCSLPPRRSYTRINNITVTMAAYTIVMVRHGESEWNQKNLFCGWFDADLSDTGINEAKSAGQMLKEKGFSFDCAFTSVLKRAIKTLYLIQEELDLHWIPVTRHWRLNERHYGALQGLNKAETAQKYGEDQVKIWRRSYDVPPPALEEGDSRCASGQKSYADLDKRVIPKCECLKDTVARALPFWHDVIVPALRTGKKPIIAAHGNSLRAMVKYLDKMTDDEILNLNIPTGIPLVYELDKDLNPIKHYYVADEAKVKAAMDKVANQGKAK